VIDRRVQPGEFVAREGGRGDDERGKRPRLARNTWARASVTPGSDRSAVSARLIRRPVSYAKPGPCQRETVNLPVGVSACRKCAQLTSIYRRSERQM
jgi:hypothetical protein